MPSRQTIYVQRTKPLLIEQLDGNCALGRLRAATAATPEQLEQLLKPA
jgi:hypothetical protein